MKKNTVLILLLTFLGLFQSAQAMEIDPRCDAKHIRAFAVFGKCVMRENIKSFGFRGDGVLDYSRCITRFDRLFDKQLARATSRGMTCTLTDSTAAKSDWISMQEDLYQHYQSNDPLEPLP